MIPLNKMPDESKVWIYQSDRKFTNKEVAKIEEKLSDFISNWTSHGTALKASGVVLYNQFLILCADEESAKASGCSIDKSVAFIKHLEKEFNCNFFNRLLIYYKENNEIKNISYHLLIEKLEKNEISKDMLIFNNTITRKKELSENWIIPIKDSWIATQLS